MAEKMIVLACAAGMSTSMLVKKMQDIAQTKEKDYEIFARPVQEIDDLLRKEPKPDAILLGPQVSYLKDDLQKKANAAGVPLDMINMVDYGMMNGTNVLAMAEKMMK